MPKLFRTRAVSSLTNERGVYALVDLDGTPLYVGQSVDGIRNRVRRHLTSARSDIIANRQIDVWEVAEVWAWPVEPQDRISGVEAAIFHHFDRQQTLMNGSIPTGGHDVSVDPPHQVVIVMDDGERKRRLDPSVRLPRQIEQYRILVDYILNVKDARHLRRSARAHYQRLSKYHGDFLIQAGGDVRGSEDEADEHCEER